MALGSMALCLRVRSCRNGLNKPRQQSLRCEATVAQQSTGVSMQDTRSMNSARRCYQGQGQHQYYGVGSVPVPCLHKQSPSLSRDSPSPLPKIHTYGL